ncbi:hypothetical protein DID88_008812 [Monilinia fructigena]|uniref:Chromatin modification-related protein n=1 Tax=Monilinia fructigena TaxID=38457 RepID=A0A395J7J0_9HELO|nr:hypothetical protein DID88_008812 [Monilinia fructigena]
MSSRHVSQLRKWMLASPPIEWGIDKLRELLIGALRKGPIPQHVAFVMDGNRRFARSHKIETVEGHNLGFEALARVLEVCYKSGVKVVTVYAFSIENFKRSKYEVDALMEMAKVKLVQLAQHGDLLDRYGASVRVLGQRNLVKDDVLEAIDRAVEMTKDNGDCALNICFPYTSRDEITTAIKTTVENYSTPTYTQQRPFSQARISQKLKSRNISSVSNSALRASSPTPSNLSERDESVSSSTTLNPESPPTSGPEAGVFPDPELISIDTLAENLFTAGDPPLDLLIRTSGVNRLSDFMLWQCHETTEIVFLDCLWPEFDLWQFLPVLVEWQWKQKHVEEKAQGNGTKASNIRTPANSILKGGYWRVDQNLSAKATKFAKVDDFPESDDNFQWASEVKNCTQNHFKFDLRVSHSFLLEFLSWLSKFTSTFTMKTTKAHPSDPSSSRRAQPLRQTRNNPPRSSLPGSRPLGSRGSTGGGDGVPNADQTVEIFPAITQFADAISALPKELVRHFTLLKEVDAKVFGPEEELARLVDIALNTPPPTTTLNYPSNSRSASTNGNNHSASINGSLANGNGGPAGMVTEMQGESRHFQACASYMQNMLVSLDEKNHVISTASEALNKQLARLDQCFPYIEKEVSEEARYGSTTHWAYPENRISKSNPGSSSRRDAPPTNTHSTATQQLVEEHAARSDARKQALLAKKGAKAQHADSDFDDTQEGKKADSHKRPHGNSKARKAATAEASTSVGLGITNGNGTNGNPPKRRKVEKSTNAAPSTERSLSGVFASNGTVSKGKAASPRSTPVPDGTKKTSRARAAPNGQARKRNNTVNSAMSPSLASSPIRTTFPDIRPPVRASPAPTNGARPASARARQNSVQSIADTARRPPSSTSNKPNGNTPGTPDLAAAASVTGKTVQEVKATMKEAGTNGKGEHLLEDAQPQNPEVLGAIVVGHSKESMKREETVESNGDPMQGIQSTTVTTTKSGRASKPSTPAIPSFVEPVRSRSSRSVPDPVSTAKRSHKKGAGAAAQLIAQQNMELDDTTSSAQGDDEDAEIDADEPTYCYCNAVSYGEMVACDDLSCDKEWFHLDCVGLKVAPKGNAKWYCDDLDKLQQDNGVFRNSVCL